MGASTPTATPTQPEAAGRSAPLEVVVTKAPSGPWVDGKLDDWGGTIKVQAVTMGVREGGVYIAVPRPMDDVTIALADQAPVPDIGWGTLSGGETHPATVDRCGSTQTSTREGGWVSGGAAPAGLRAKCLELLDRHAAFAKAYRARFIHLIHVTSGGVEVFDGSGTKVVVNGTTHAAGADGIEAWLLQDGLPRLSQAPLRTLSVAAIQGIQPAAFPAPDAKGSSWRRVELPEPVEFAPNDELRRFIFDSGKRENHTVQLSYEASDPGSIGVLRQVETPLDAGAIQGLPNRPEVRFESSRILGRRTEWGDAVIGIAPGRTAHVVVFRDDKIAAFIPVDRVVGMVERSGNMQVLGVNQLSVDTWPGWNVVEVDKHGATIHSELSSRDYSVPESKFAWDADPEAYWNRDFTELGLRGTHKAQKRQLMWRWSSSSAHYEAR